MEEDKKQGVKMNSTDVISTKKLALVLDLDNTLVHTTKQTMPGQDHPIPVIHFRPHVNLFLQEASTLFDIYISTMARLGYASFVAKKLDRSGSYFRKIFSFVDSTNGKKRMDIIPHDVRHVIVVDDNELVWRSQGRDNLIYITKYFAGHPDSALQDVLRVLRRAHSVFFDGNYEDIRVVLRKIRKEVLHDCCIVGDWLPPIAHELGALVLREIKKVDDSEEMNVDASAVTHVISESMETEWARWAVRKGKFLVSPLWLLAAYHSWRRPDEKEFQHPAKM